MITITSVIFNAIWIVGLAGVLATLSYTDWVRKTRGQSWKVATTLPSFLVPFQASMCVVAIGVALSGWNGRPAQPLWQTIFWGVLALLLLIQSYAALDIAKKQGWDIELPK